jgi:hypothetical protein
MTFEKDKGRLSGRKPQLEVATTTDHSTAGSEPRCAAVAVKTVAMQRACCPRKVHTNRREV